MWPYRLSVRTAGFHPVKRGSTPRRVTKQKMIAFRRFFCFDAIRQWTFEQSERVLRLSKMAVGYA